MNENIVELLKKIADSEELQAQFGKLGTLDEAYDLAGKIQQGFTREEFLDAMKALNETADEEISDKELAATAGGGDVECNTENPKDTKTLSCVTKTNLSALSVIRPITNPYTISC